MSETGSGYQIIPIEKQYEHLTEKIMFHIEASINTSKLFVQWFAAIVGGSIWLRIQIDGVQNYVFLSNSLIVLLATLTSLMIIDNVRAWYGYRKEISRISGVDENGDPNIRPPRITSAISEASMLIAIATASAVFCLLNPFSH